MIEEEDFEEVEVEEIDDDDEEEDCLVAGTPDFEDFEDGEEEDDAQSFGAPRILLVEDLPPEEDDEEDETPWPKEDNQMIREVHSIVTRNYNGSTSVGSGEPEAPQRQLNAFLDRVMLNQHLSTVKKEDADLNTATFKDSRSLLVPGGVPLNGRDLRGYQM